jgi:hypothetical protein
VAQLLTKEENPMMDDEKLAINHHVKIFYVKVQSPTHHSALLTSLGALYLLNLEYSREQDGQRDVN